MQVSLEATYISQTPTTLPETPQTPQVIAPSRTSSFAGKSRPASSHPSLFPPHTPNPIPSSTDRDRKYAQSEGTLLLGSIWGHKPANLSKEKFSLFHSEARNAWLAVYELSLTVCECQQAMCLRLFSIAPLAFLRLPFSDPLLSLTVSTTLRDKAVALSQASHPFVIFLAESGILPKLSASGMSEFSKKRDQDTDDGEADDQTGLEEVNLLEGLSAGGLTCHTNITDNLIYTSSRTCCTRVGTSMSSLYSPGERHSSTDVLIAAYAAFIYPATSVKLQAFASCYSTKIVSQDSPDRLWLSGADENCFCPSHFTSRGELRV